MCLCSAFYFDASLRCPELHHYKQDLLLVTTEATEAVAA